MQNPSSFRLAKVFNPDEERKIGAGDGGRTRDIDLGKIVGSCKSNNLAAQMTTHDDAKTPSNNGQLHLL
jgi:hypothetical protein